jgi:type II secretory ATPase GspE/PulE/Tfp pilus assembly ATPase PilB-like protein
MKDPDGAQQAVLEAWTEKYANAEGRFTLYRAVGCDQCSGGYKGRVGLHELMLGSDKLKRLIQEHSRVAVLLAAALEDGMLTLKKWMASRKYCPGSPISSRCARFASSRRSRHGWVPLPLFNQAR